MGDCLSTHNGLESAEAIKQMAAPVVIPAASRHTATVIFMHGLGDTGHGWAAAFQQIASGHIKYVCPTAPTQPVTLNAGFQMPSWFDIKSLSVDAEQDEDGIKLAAQQITALVENETKAGISSDRIVLGGFSQGGALALYAALHYPKPLAGLLALSAWLPVHDKMPPADCPANHKTHVLQCHGEIDPLVIPAVGQLTASYIKKFNPNHSFKMYPSMAHSSCEQEMADVKTFLDKRLPPV